MTPLILVPSSPDEPAMPISWSGQTSGPQLPNALTFTTSPTDQNLLLVHPEGVPSSSVPLFSVVHNETASPNITLFHGHPSPTSQLATANFALDSTGPFTISHRGQAISGEFKKHTGLSLPPLVANTPMGTWKWKLDELHAKSLELKDKSGRKIATDRVGKGSELLSSGKIKPDDPRANSLQIFVPTEPVLVELVCLTFAMQRARRWKKAEKADKPTSKGVKVAIGAIKVASALAGAPTG